VVLAPAIINVLACLTFGVLDNFGMTRLHDCDTGVGSAKIDSNNTKKLENVYPDLRGEVVLRGGKQRAGEGGGGVSLSLQKVSQHLLCV
jgi:hypothetical protein